jgi:hypothetical protein
MYYFVIDLLAIIPLPPYSYLGRWWSAVTQFTVHENATLSDLSVD